MDNSKNYFYSKRVKESEKDRSSNKRKHQTSDNFANDLKNYKFSKPFTHGTNNNEDYYVDKNLSLKPQKEKSRFQKSDPILPEKNRTFDPKRFATDSTLPSKRPADNMNFSTFMSKNDNQPGGTSSGSNNTGLLSGFKTLDSSLHDLSSDLRNIEKNGNNLGVERSKFVKVQDLPSQMMEFLNKDKSNHKKNSGRSGSPSMSSPVDDKITRRIEKQKISMQRVLENMR